MKFFLACNFYSMHSEKMFGSIAQNENELEKADYEPIDVSDVFMVI